MFTNDCTKIQAKLNNIIYKNIENNLGGNISFVFFIRNEFGDRLNYVITMRSFNNGYSQERKEIELDTSTNTYFVSTIVDVNQEYSTISDISDIVNTKNGFYRINITAQNLRNAFRLSPFSDTNIENWKLDFIGVQFELEESQGYGELEGSFNDFKAFISDKRM